jgi:hypothetical protein
MQADTIALISVATPPANVNIGAGPVASAYAAVQYNGAVITTAQVTPPAFLNVLPKVINKIAGRRNAAAAVPRQVTPVTAEIPPVIVGGPDPLLPPDDILKPLLGQSQWGNAFIGLVRDIRTPIQITTESIDSIFAFGDGIIDNQACKNSYVQAIMDLLKLPSGISLFRNIIIAHHCQPKLPKVRFASRNTESKISLVKDNQIELSEVNLQWVEGAHVGGEFMCIAANDSLPAAAPAVAGAPPAYPGRGSQVDFVNVNVPASVILAHELGHYLHYLESYKRTIELGGGSIIAEAIESTPAGSSACKAAFTSNNWAVLHNYPYMESKGILEKVVTHTPPNAVEQIFIELWNHGVYNEIVNILPTADILRNGGSGYSDGIIIGEALLAPNCSINRQISFSRKNEYGQSERIDFVNLQNGIVEGASFVRFGHVGSKRFWSILDQLIVRAAASSAIRTLGPNAAAVGDLATAMGRAISAALGGPAKAMSSSATARAAAVGSNSAVVAAANALMAKVLPPPAVTAAAVANVAASVANAVNDALTEFKDLVQKLLDTITVGGQALWANNNNLPRL